MALTSGATADDAVLALSLGSAIMYFFQIRVEPCYSRMASKTLSTTLLAVFAAMQSNYWQLVPALGLGSLGDACLAWEGDKSFLRGLSSFLVAHLFYVALFVGAGNGINHILNDSTRLGIAVGILLLAPFMNLQLLPVVNARLRIPIATYSAVIVAMVLAVLTVDNKQVIYGAVLFAISDTNLSTEKFLLPKDSKLRPLLQYVTWILYYSGQALIATGLVEGKDWINQRR